MQVFQVAIDRFEIGVLAAEQRLDIPVGVLEFTLQTLNASFAHEFRGLPQQVQTRAISNLQGSIGTGRGGNSAEHEFRIQPVAALLEIATIGHLRDQIRGAQQVSQFAIAGVGELDLVQLDFITGEMHDSGRNRHPVFHADARQESGQETCAAGYVVEGELGAVAMLPVAEFPDVARIMKQRCDQSHDRPLGTEAHASLDAALVPHQQARHGQGHIERVLAIVVDGIHAVVARHTAREELVELVERDSDSIERLARKSSRK